MNQEIERQLEGLLIDAVMCGEIPFGNLLVRKDGEEFCYLGQAVERVMAGDYSARVNVFSHKAHYLRCSDEANGAGKAFILG